MKKLVYVKAAWCPYCNMATRWLDGLIKKDERFKDLEIEVIDIDEDKERAKDYPHELVPNFWIEGEKIFEGIPTRPVIKEVLEKTL